MASAQRVIGVESDPSRLEIAGNAIHKTDESGFVKEKTAICKIFHVVLTIFDNGADHALLTFLFIIFD